MQVRLEAEDNNMDLTLTRVVFELNKLSLVEIFVKNLTLTRVVFEYVIYVFC